jgi:hypothetical protein
MKMWPLWTVALYLHRLKLYVLFINGKNETVLYRQWFVIERYSLRQVWLYMVKLSEGEGWDPINRLNLTTFLCMSDARSWISNAICLFLHSMVWDERWFFVLMILVELLDHQCLNFLFITSKYLSRRDFRQVSGFLRCPPPIKLTSTIQLKYCWKWR